MVEPFDCSTPVDQIARPSSTPTTGEAIPSRIQLRRELSRRGGGGALGCAASRRLVIGSPGWAWFHLSATVAGPEGAPHSGHTSGRASSWWPQAGQRHSIVTMIVEGHHDTAGLAVRQLGLRHVAACGPAQSRS